MTKIWRIYLMKGTPKDNVPINDYCFKNKIAAMGWGLYSRNDDIKSGKITINSYEDYEKYAKVEPNIGKFYDVRRLACEAKAGDFIWTRVSGEHNLEYYLAKISPDSKYHYNYSDEAIKNEACNELTNIDWKFVGDTTVIDTDIINYSRGLTFCQLIDPDASEENREKFEEALKYTQDIYNKL